MSYNFKNIKSYSAPKNENIVVCSVLFNSCNYIKPVMNHLYVANMLKKSNIPHYIIELLYPNQTPNFEESDTVFHVNSNSYMFHKENLFNILISRLPKKFTKIVCLDGDVVFDDSDWINKIDQELDKFDVVYPYHEAFVLDPFYENVLYVSKILMDTRYKSNQVPFSSGYAVGLHRNFFERIGMYEYGIFGGSDKLLLHDYVRIPIKVNTFNSNKRSEYLEKLKSLGLKYSYLNGVVYHLYHGSILDRKYLERHNFLNELNIDLEIIKNDDGVLEFINPEKYNPTLLDYFKNRNEDNLNYQTTKNGLEYC